MLMYPRPAFGEGDELRSTRSACRGHIRGCGGSEIAVEFVGKVLISHLPPPARLRDRAQPSMSSLA